MNVQLENPKIVICTSVCVRASARPSSGSVAWQRPGMQRVCEAQPLKVQRGRRPPGQV